MDDLGGLERELRAAVRGGVDCSVTARALNTMDASNYRRVPLGVCTPADGDDVAAALEVCRRRGVPVVGRGGGTSIAGQATGTGLVLDFTRHMNGVVDLDPGTRTAVVQPGLVLDRLQAAAAPHGLRFGPDPSTHSRCTIGGMIGNNSCGSHSVAWGTTADSVAALDVVAGDGCAYRLGQGWDGAPAGLRELVERESATVRTGFAPYTGLPRRISGYAVDALLPEHGTDLARFLCGTEGTLGLVTEATVRLVEAPPAKALAVLAYADESAAAEAAAGLLPHGPLTVEGMAADLVPPDSGLPKGGAWLFVETGGATPAEARAAADRIVRSCDRATVVDALVVADPAGQRALWRIREDASGTATRMPDGSEAWPGWEDCAVPPARLGAYLRDFRGLLTEHGLRGTPYGHFGDGCIHVRIDFDLLTAPGIARFRRFSEDLATLVVAHGGSLSGEHGDGQARAELLPKMYGPALVGLFERVKAVWDPADLLNPGILVRPARLDENLRFAPLPREPVGPVDIAFGYPHDNGDFSAAVRRCVGVAKCRVQEPSSGGGVMCPSFRATGGDETHSTRGRARLLHEMLAGEVITDGWRSQEVRDALDLCLSCKGCRSDCPVGVDMATYKAEFLHHHYAGRRRPAAHYTMGWLPRWLRLVERTRTAGLVNSLTSVGVLAAAGKRVGGIARERRIPRVARQTFSAWWRAQLRRRVRERRFGPRGQKIAVLWPDTFTEHLAPEVGRAAVRVLEAAGVTALLPPRTRFTYRTEDGAPVAVGGNVLDPRRSRVCCGLTYLSTGQLDRAREVLKRTLDLMPSVVDADVPVIVLEPSCGAALRSDLPELLPDDPRARRLADRVVTFAEALERLAPDWAPPRLDRAAVGQTHCHQHAVLGDAADRRLRERAGLEGELSGGCCGLAGNFGFEDGHYDVSVACAEESLLPAVRSAGDGDVVLADGFSCRTQLEQLAGRRGRHIAEVLAEGLDGG
ncbi:FAD-binding and (Fe-S)-binding domain-containing protein [Streptomyces sp. VRA16 Mangrove soil]|uniref:FAD-binding and (Fe-S)-binding domain-containing protein n=1 Tax=Streptomyces sp. VRA16 Mangrove soil TaxID=2817434 RepID=UPI001A9D9534|nr:FAD-binding and (Fe-S)-binding domain-containing protein [Streptomyces sp. VRA16 Mangrove soil]MBO1337621.1 FAD-binding oxidoreductase [Streptomyces sp. VRA16 Mangrove soil]